MKCQMMLTMVKMILNTHMNINVHHIKMEPFGYDMMLLTEGHPYWDSSDGPEHNRPLYYENEDFNTIDWCIVADNMNINEHKNALVFMVFENDAQKMYDFLVDIEIQSNNLIDNL